MADHSITVTRVGNTLVCVPHETVAKPGDTITWIGPSAGPPHSGRFLGKVRNAPRTKRGFTKAEHSGQNVENGVHPVPNPAWTNGQVVQIPANATAGAYAYMVEIDDLANPGHKIQSDPVVIIDDGGGA